MCRVRERVWDNVGLRWDEDGDEDEEAAHKRVYCGRRVQQHRKSSWVPIGKISLLVHGPYFLVPMYYVNVPTYVPIDFKVEILSAVDGQTTVLKTYLVACNCLM